MRKLSKLTSHISSLLSKEEEPKSMKWIMVRVLKKYPDVNHRQVWNSVWNGCVTDRFRKSMKDGTALFCMGGKV